jgi:hypothetical protein
LSRPLVLLSLEIYILIMDVFQRAPQHSSQKHSA